MRSSRSSSAVCAGDTTPRGAKPPKDRNPRRPFHGGEAGTVVAVPCGYGTNGFSFQNLNFTYDRYETALHPFVRATA